MEILFQPRSGIQSVELRDVSMAGFARWNAGDQREIPDANVQVTVLGEIHRLSLAQAVFAHGPDFVDAKTGKNPLYVCADCGAEALDEQLPDANTLDPIRFENDKGQRLCSTCFLKRNPQLHTQFSSRGFGDQVRAAQEVLDRPAPSAKPKAEAQTEGEV